MQWAPVYGDEKGHGQHIAKITVGRPCYLIDVFCKYSLAESPLTGGDRSTKEEESGRDTSWNTETMSTRKGDLAAAKILSYTLWRECCEVRSFLVHLGIQRMVYILIVHIVSCVIVHRPLPEYVTKSSWNLGQSSAPHARWYCGGGVSLRLCSSVKRWSLVSSAVNLSSVDGCRLSLALPVLLVGTVML